MKRVKKTGGRERERERREREREMAKDNEVENGKRRRAKGSKIEGKKGQSQSKNGGNNKKKNSKSSKSKTEGNGKYVDEEPEVLVAPDSEDDDGDEKEDVVRDGDEEEDEEEETNRAENGGGKEKEEATKKIKKRKENGKRKKSEGDDGDSSSTCFPMNRISRIIKSEDADIRITQESVFLVNKATEKFLELFCKEAHACALLDSKNQVWYKHLCDRVLHEFNQGSEVEPLAKFYGFKLGSVPHEIMESWEISSVVSKRKRFDFLLDIVPEKVKAEDALAEMSVAET
ncbi:hypothetical protein RHSIM_Rhsim01G0217900 [Rhododendron simsii]|uniref:Transcription factor CBF/NF-Y/archaeal histone domain-containing protein n=1 Tax=Rhododendron simsii TaxID=118357 RepID=A0A834HQE1_RHOSS|nr:hypothetical protein RHSIM_Rhsim01G0217900 [Rhododendron simsii]